MTEYDLHPGTHTIGLNHSNTVGVMEIPHLPSEKRQKTMFTPKMLREWAEAVEECYGKHGVVELVCHKDAPMVARQIPEDDDEEEAVLGIGIAPRLPPEKV